MFYRKGKGAYEWPQILKDTKHRIDQSFPNADHAIFAIG